MQPLQTSHPGGVGANPPLAAVLPLPQQPLPLPRILPEPGQTSSAFTAAEQQLLFPSTARSVCDEIGLNWLAAIKLYEDGWLSFSPEDAGRLNETEESELRFVGALVVAGCDRGMLSSLLSGLPKPYALPANKLYFNWVARQWRILPDPVGNPEATFSEWLESLVQRGELGSIRGILELTHEALARLSMRLGQQELS